MKGQAINLDFTIALALFLFTAAGTIAAVQAQRGDATTPGRSSQVADRLVSQISTQGYQRDLVMSSPVSVQDYPIDRELEFAPAAEPGSGSFQRPASVNISTGSFVSVPDLGNRSLRLSYLSVNPGLSSRRLEDDLTARDDAYLNNSDIRLSLADPGLEALVDRDLNRDLVRERGNVSIPGSDLSTSEDALSASSLSGNLKMYNGSPEFVVEQGPVAFRLKNLSTVYVLDGNRTLSVGPGFDRGFSTPALALTESPSSSESGGLVFAGDLSIQVRNTTSGVDVEVSFGDRLRVRPVENLSEGFRRSLAERGHAKFGPPESFQAAWSHMVADLASLDDAGMRERLGIGNDLNYNISLGEPTSVGGPPWTGNFDGTDVESGDLVLDSAAGSALYNETYTTGGAPVSRVTVSGVERPEDVLLELRVETPRGTYSRSVSNGTQSFALNTGVVDSFELRLRSRRAGGDGNWTVDSYSVFYGSAFEKGATLPPRGDVDTETQVLPRIGPNGTFSPSVLEVRTWD